MKKFSEKYKKFLYESLDDKYKDKLSEDYLPLKRGILDLLDDSIEDTDELVNVQNFINSYIETPDSETLVGFVNDADIFNFYLKFQGSIDDICQDKKYFDTPPVENNIFTLYNFIVNGTKFATIETMKILQKELFD